MDNELCHNCSYEWGHEDLDENGYCPNCACAYESGYSTGSMSALQDLAGIDPSKLSNLDKLSGDERYTLFVRLLND